MVQGQDGVPSKREIGARLAELRTACGKSRREAAERLGCSENKVGTIERGEVGIDEGDLADLLDLYQADDEQRASLARLAGASRQRRARTKWGPVVPDRFKKLFEDEQIAEGIEIYRADMWPGLLHDPDYARAAIRTNPFHSPSQVELLVQARLARLTQLLNRANPPRLTLVITQGAIEEIVGDAETTAAQIKYVRDLFVAHKGVFEMRAIPKGVPIGAAMKYPFTIFTERGRKTVYAETLTDTLHVEEQLRLDLYKEAFTQLLAAALDHKKTMALLDKVVSQL